MPRKSDTLKFHAEDQSFLDSQADALGCDAQTYLRMVVRQMRLGQIPTLGFGGARVQRQKPEPQQYFDAPEVMPPTSFANWGNPAPIPEQNEPADDFSADLRDQDSTEYQQSTPTRTTPSIVDDMVRIAAADGAHSVTGQSAPSAASTSVTALRRSLKASTAAPQIQGAPGSATRIVGVNRQFALDQQGDGKGNVQRQNMKHFFGR